jgi:hypothetical protein
MITIIKQAPPMTPIYNRFDNILDSTLKGKSKFSYIVDLMVNGEGVSELRIPSNYWGYGVFNLSEHLNITGSDFNPNNINFTIATNSFCTYSCQLSEQFREEWGFTAIQNNGGFIRLSGTQTHYFQNGEQIIVSGNLTDTSYLGVATITSNTSTTITLNKSINATASESGEVVKRNFELTTISSTASIGKQFAWKAVLDYKGEIDWDWSDWTIGSNLSNLLTNVPNNYEVYLDDDMWIASYATMIFNRWRLRFETNLGVYQINNTFTSPSSNDYHRFLYTGCGPNNLIGSSFSVVSGSATPFDATTTHYDIWMVNSSNNQTSKKYRFKIKKNCNNFNEYLVIFLDRMGSFIPFRFTLKDKINVQIERESYNKSLGVWSTNQYNFNTWDRGLTNLNINGEEVWTLNSDWVSEAISDYLVEMVMSPEVYIKIDGDYYSCVVDVNSYEKKKRWDGLISIQIKIKLSNKIRSQK